MMDMKIGWKAPAVAVFIALVSLFLFSSSATETFPYLNPNATVTVCGKEFPSTAETLVFSGEEVTGIDEILSTLGDFSQLKSVDLGTYSVDLSDVQKINEVRGGVSLAYHTHVSMYGKNFDTESTQLDLDGVGLTSVAELTERLPYLPKVTKVVSRDSTVSREDKLVLCDAFPTVEFDISSIVTICGTDVRDDATVLDLRDCVVEADMIEKLSALTKLESVDLHGAQITTKLQKELVDTYPDVSFLWDVEVLGETYQSDVEELDLSGKSGVTLDDLKYAVPLFGELKSIDMHETPLTPEKQKQFREAYPELRFRWDVELGGEKYDSEIEDLDLTAKGGLTLDAIRQAIPLFCDLKRLDLSDCGFANETLATLREEFPETKIVWRIYMGRWSLKTDAVAFSVLIYTYDYKRLTSADIQVLKYCTDLQALDLGHQALTDLSVIGDYLPELRILILADNTVSDLTPIAKLKHLHYLELFVNPYLSDVSPIAACKEMVDLNISHLYTVSDISALYDFPLMERFWIEHTAVPEADIQRLRSTYPNARVVNIGYGSVDQGWRSHPRYFAMIDMYHQHDYISEEFSKYDSAD